MTMGKHVSSIVDIQTSMANIKGVPVYMMASTDTTTWWPWIWRHGILVIVHKHAHMDTVWIYMLS